MPRNISFALTTKQFNDRSKDVTRRLGWLHLKVGDQLCGVKKAMGLRPGEKIERLGMIRVTDVRREPLGDIINRGVGYAFDEVAREGFPAMRPADFIRFFCASHKGCTVDSLVTRIQFEHI